MPVIRLPRWDSPPALLLPLAVIGVLGCTVSLPLAGTSQTPRPSASSAPSVGPIDHPTGPSDIVLRFEEGGGFVPPSFLATQAPWFTLYGDGSVVYRSSAAVPVDEGDGVIRGAPFRIARLTEEQIQVVLDRAINAGALGIARGHYDSGMIADAPTATFTINAGGLNKTVSVVGLGIDVKPGVDSLTLKALAGVAEWLRDFDDGATAVADLYIPSSYRGILSDGSRHNGPLLDWPWPTVRPTDFVPGPNDAAVGFARRVLTADEVSKLGVREIAGGAQGIRLKGPDDNVYVLDLRPLLPGETS